MPCAGEAGSKRTPEGILYRGSGALTQVNQTCAHLEQALTVELGLTLVNTDYLSSQFLIQWWHVARGPVERPPRAPRNMRRG